MNNSIMIPKLYKQLSAFCEEYEMPEIPMNIHYISGEIHIGECGEIYEKEELRCRFEDDKEDGECEEWETFEDFLDEVTDMGGYFVRNIPYYFEVLLDGMVMEDENCASARFDDIEEALEEAVDRAERNAAYDWISGEWKQPKITLECFFCG